MFDHILVPLDGSQLAEVALPFALAILAPEGKLTLLRVVDTPRPAFSISPSPPLLKEEVEHYQSRPQARFSESEIYLRHTAETLGQTGLQIDRLTVVEENPASAIARACKDLAIECLVMATHGRSGLDRWLMGSVTQAVLQIAPCPIFVIPSRLTSQTAGQYLENMKGQKLGDRKVK